MMGPVGNPASVKRIPTHGNGPGNSPAPMGKAGSDSKEEKS